MKKAITQIWTQLRGDRPLISLCIVILLLVLVYVIYVALSLAPSELQLATRYTAFGETQYYRDKWYYLLTFIVFALVVAGMHIGLLIKLHLREMRSMALLLGWLTLLLFLILFVLTWYVLGVAYLS